MTEYVYLYEPRGYSPGYVYRSFYHALNHLLNDENYDTVEEYIADLKEWGVWYEIDIDNRVFGVDDGAHITEIELL